MSELTTAIGPYDPEKRTVPVTFTLGAIVHTRDVNACLLEGAYHADSTIARVADVARGVAAKIAVGAIVAETAPE